MGKRSRPPKWGILNPDSGFLGDWRSPSQRDAVRTWRGLLEDMPNAQLVWLHPADRTLRRLGERLDCGPDDEGSQLARRDFFGLAAARPTGLSLSIDPGSDPIAFAVFDRGQLVQSGRAPSKEST